MVGHLRLHPDSLAVLSQEASLLRCDPAAGHSYAFREAENEKRSKGWPFATAPETARFRASVASALSALERDMAGPCREGSTSPDPSAATSLYQGVK